MKSSSLVRFTSIGPDAPLRSTRQNSRSIRGLTDEVWSALRADLMEQALSDLRVLDLTHMLAGPFCAMLLGDLGADVIKVEAPGGDSTRKMPGHQGTESPAFWAVNRNKRGVVFNLKDARAREALRSLVAWADILLENYRPGVMDSLELGYRDLRELNPGLIYASISGFGQTGAYAQRGGFDLVAQGMSGIMSITGEEGRAPVKCGVPITDLAAGLFALQAILAAYIYRLSTGKGQFIDTSLLDAGIALSIWESAQYFSGRGIPGPMGSAHRMSAPYQAIKCADGYITIGAANQRNWERLTKAIGKPDLMKKAEYTDDARRVQNRHLVVQELEATTRTHPCDYWIRLLSEAGVPCGPIRNYAEVFTDPHVLARGMVQELDHPVAGRLRVLGPAAKLSETPACIKRPAPLYGEHTAEVLREIGYSDGDIQALAESGIVVLATTEQTKREFEENQCE